MAALSFTTDIRDAVSLRAFNNDYAALATWQASMVTDAGADALAALSAYGQYFIGALTDSTAPTSWEAWLTAEATAILLESQGDGRAQAARARADRARDAALTYEFDTSDNNTAGAITLLAIRQHVGVTMARRGKFPDLRQIDRAVDWAIGRVWNMKNWNFKQRPVTITIATDSTVTVSDTVSLEQLNTAKLWYTDEAASGQFIEWVGADEMAFRRATVTETGRPEQFRTYKSSANAWVWQWSPEPDQEYTVRTEALIVGPPAITDETSNTPFAGYPTAFTPLLMDMVLAKVMVELGERDGQGRLDRAEDDIEAMFPQYQSMGKPVEDRWSVRDVYGDFAGLEPDWGNW